MLYNNQSPYTVGLLVPARDALRRWLQQQGLSCRTAEGQEAALRLLESELGRYREGGDRAGSFPSRWVPRTVAVLGEAFTEQNHLLNSTMKMVRARIAEYYRNRLDYLYSPAGRSTLNEQNRAIVARLEQ